MGDEELNRRVKVTRAELYQQVWKMPMSRLAAQYGISGNGLAKICQRLKVPYPERGYWARIEAGQNVVQHQLPNSRSAPRASAV